MLIVGLTGGIASGKSTVSELFEQAGVPVLCLDELAREAVAPSAPALDDIRRIFGDEFIDGEGGLDREAMARLVFRDEGKRKLLESIIHPRLAQEVDNRIEQLERQGHRMVVADVPLLYEIKWDLTCDLVVVVYVPEQIQEKRLMERDGVPLQDARARLEAQMSIEEKKKRADYVVDNTGDIAKTRDQVLGILRELESRVERGDSQHRAGKESG